MTTITVGVLREKISTLPDSALLLAEEIPTFGFFADKFNVVDAMAIGASTEDPGLVLKLELMK